MMWHHVVLHAYRYLFFTPLWALLMINIPINFPFINVIILHFMF